MNADPISGARMTAGHLWLPYSQMQTAPEPLNVARTDGVRLTLADGRTLIDGIASWRRSSSACRT
jgi:adenosylmethionine-8-amino-7-oxononanoate aminotransferase